MPLPLLIQKLQEAAPSVRVMLIPVGDGLPDDMQAAAIHGVLTKPFFVGDLGHQIATVLGVESKPLVTLPPPPEKKAHETPKPRVRQVAQAPARNAEPTASQPAPSRHRRPAPPGPSAPPPARSPTPRVRQIVQPTTRSGESPRRSVSRSPDAQPKADAQAALNRILNRLAHETRADAVVVLRHGALVTQRSTFPAARIEAFVELIVRWAKVAAETAVLVGEAYGRFPQMHLEGERYHVYATDQGNGIVVVVISRTDVSVGTLRLNAKAAAAEIVIQLR